MSPDSKKALQKFGWRDLLGYSISALLLWYTFYKSGLHFSDIRLKGEQWLYFIGAIAVFVFSLWLYSVRAKLIWAGHIKKDIPFHTYSSLILGNFYNCILPGNLGEGVRASHFGRKNGVAFARSLAAIITEKWLDAQVFGVLVILLFIIKPFMSHFISYSLAYTALVILILSVIHVLMLRYSLLEKRLWGFVLYIRVVGKFFFKLYYHTIQHLKCMKRKGTIFTYILFFVLIFVLNGMQFFLLEKAAGVPMPVAGFYSAFLISLSMMIIAFIPSAPSNIGVLHYGVYSALILAARQYGIDPNAQELQSFALFAIYVHLSFLLPEVALGTIFLVRERKALF